MLLPRDAAPLNSLGLRKAAAGDAGRRGHVRRRRQLGGGGDAGRRGLRRRRRDAAALRPRRGAGEEGRLLRRARHPRRPAGGRGDGLPALRARLRGPLPRQRGRRVRRRLPRRRDAGALHPLQRAGEVPRPAGDGARPRGRLHGDRALRPALRRAARGRSCTAPPIRRATRATSSSPPRREQLGYLRFPLGGLASKAETRALAARYGLPVADKPDSQDICFVPNGSYAAVIEKLRPGAAEPGEIVHLDGRVLGRHDGVIRYTVGQRRGLGIGGGEPLFVVRLDAEARRVVVGPREALASRTVTVAEVNWLGDGAVRGGAGGRLGGRRCGCARPGRRSRRGSIRAGRSRARVELLAAGGGRGAGAGLRLLRAGGQRGCSAAAGSAARPDQDCFRAAKGTSLRRPGQGAEHGAERVLDRDRRASSPGAGAAVRAPAHREHLDRPGLCAGLPRGGGLAGARTWPTIGFEPAAATRRAIPIVVAHGGDGAGPHFLFYGHYDVQPVDPLELWDRPPFEPAIARRARGKAIFGRGASDDKGQVMTFLEAVRAWKAVTGRHPGAADRADRGRGGERLALAGAVPEGERGGAPRPRWRWSATPACWDRRRRRSPPCCAGSSGTR